MREVTGADAAVADVQSTTAISALVVVVLLTVPQVLFKKLFDKNDPKIGARDQWVASEKRAVQGDSPSFWLDPVYRRRSEREGVQLNAKWHALKDEGIIKSNAANVDNWKTANVDKPITVDKPIPVDEPIPIQRAEEE